MYRMDFPSQYLSGKKRVGKGLLSYSHQIDMAISQIFLRPVGEAFPRWVGFFQIVLSVPQAAVTRSNHRNPRRVLYRLSPAKVSVDFLRIILCRPHDFRVNGRYPRRDIDIVHSHLFHHFREGKRFGEVLDDLLGGDVPNPPGIPS